MTDIKRNDTYNKKNIIFNKNKKNFKKERFGHKNDEKKIKDRIAKRLSILGIASRREAEKMVLDGKVKINGIECKDLSQLVSYEDKIAINGKEISNKPIRTQIFIMNKPAGYITSNNDPQGRRTIFELIPSKFGRLISIGRLDYNTEGILLLTNNGELARVMEMPATGLKRVYYAKVIGEINEDLKTKLAALRNGIKIEGVEYGKMIVDINDYSSTRATLRIVIFEGKNNEIRRIMWHLGLKVVKLTRVQYGDFRLNGVPEGCMQESHFRINIRDLEKQASINIKKYKERHKKDDIKEDEKNDNKVAVKSQNNKEDKKKSETKKEKIQKIEEQIKKDIDRDNNEKNVIEDNSNIEKEEICKENISQEKKVESVQKQEQVVIEEQIKQDKPQEDIQENNDKDAKN